MSSKNESLQNKLNKKPKSNSHHFGNSQNLNQSKGQNFPKDKRKQNEGKKNVPKKNQTYRREPGDLTKQGLTESSVKEDTPSGTEYLDNYRGYKPVDDNSYLFNEIPNEQLNQEEPEYHPMPIGEQTSEYKDQYVKHAFQKEGDHYLSDDSNRPEHYMEEPLNAKLEEENQKYPKQEKKLRGGKTKKEEKKGDENRRYGEENNMNDDYLSEIQEVPEYKKESEYMEQYKIPEREEQTEKGNIPFKHHISGRDGQISNPDEHPYYAGLCGASTEYKERYKGEGLPHQKGKTKHKKTESAKVVPSSGKIDHSPITSKAMKDNEPSKTWKSEYVEQYKRAKKGNDNIKFNKEYFESWEKRPMPMDVERQIMEEEYLRNQPLKEDPNLNQPWKSEYFEKYPTYKKGNDDLAHNKEYFEQWDSKHKGKNFRKGKKKKPIEETKNWDTEYVDKYKSKKRSNSFEKGNNYYGPFLEEMAQREELSNQAYKGEGSKEWKSEYIEKYPMPKRGNKKLKNKKGYNQELEKKYNPKEKEELRKNKRKEEHLSHPMNRSAEFFSAPSEEWNSEYVEHYQQPPKIEDMDVKYHKTKTNYPKNGLNFNNEGKDKGKEWCSEYVEKYKTHKRSKSMEDKSKLSQNEKPKELKYKRINQTIEQPQEKWTSEYEENYIKHKKENKDLKNNKEYFEAWDKMKAEENARNAQTLRARPIGGDNYEKEWNTEYHENYLRPNKKNNNLKGNKEYFESINQPVKNLMKDSEGLMPVEDKSEEKWNTEYHERYLKPNKKNENIRNNKEYFDQWQKKKENEPKEETLRAAPKPKNKSNKVKQWKSEYNENYTSKPNTNQYIKENPYKNNQQDNIQQSKTIEQNLCKEWSSEYNKKYLKPSRSNDNLINNKEYFNSWDEKYDTSKNKKSHLFNSQEKTNYTTEYNTKYFKHNKKNNNLLNNKEYWESWKERQKENEEQQKFRAMQRTEEKKTNKPTNKWNTEYKTNYLKPNKENTNQKFNKEYFEAWRQAQQANRKEKTEKKGGKEKTFKDLKSDKKNSQWNTEYKEHFFKHKKENRNLKNNKEYWESWKEAKKENEIKEKALEEQEKEQKLRKEKEGNENKDNQQWNSVYNECFKVPKKEKLPQSEIPKKLEEIKPKNAHEESQVTKPEEKKSDSTVDWKTEYNDHFLRPKKGNNALIGNKEYWESWDERIENAKDQDKKLKAMEDKMNQQNKEEEKNKWKTEYNDKYLRCKKDNNIKHNKEYFDSWKEQKNEYEKHIPKYRQNNEVGKGEIDLKLFNTEYGDNYLRPQRFEKFNHRKGKNNSQEPYDKREAKTIQEEEEIPRPAFDPSTEYNDRYLNYGKPFKEKRLIRHASAEVSRGGIEGMENKYNLV
ncbi:MAG: hypothetical protein MJ252_01670 [archaeon]|nr:hypothetical protein [archaeon]